MTAQSNSNLVSLLNPTSIALVGASINPEDIGSYVLRNVILSGFKGRVYPVTKEVNELFGFDTYQSIRDIDDPLDLVIIASPADKVIDYVQDCTKAKVRNICIVSRGFAESGTTGRLFQKKIRQLANEAGISVLGPNSLGTIIPSSSLNASFSSDIPSSGKSCFLSQSGALINAFVEYAKYYSLGVSHIVGFGNKSDLNENDFFQYYSSLREDGRPSVVGTYLENISNGNTFIEEASILTRKVPVLALIPSESPKTREYIYAHSGSIIQRDEVIDLALERSGVIKVYTQQELFDLLLAFSWQVLPRGNKIAVISNAGSGLILAIEQLYRSGLKLVNFSSEVKKMLSNELDWKGENNGVIDLGGDALALNYLKALDIVLGDPDTNAVLTVLSHQVMTQIDETAEAVGRLTRQHGKTVVAAFMGYSGVEKGIKSLAAYHIPAFNSVDRAVYVLSKMNEYFQLTKLGYDITSSLSQIKSQEKNRPSRVLDILELARVEKKWELSYANCKKVLSSFEINAVAFDTVSDERSFEETVKKWEYPFKFICKADKESRIIKTKEQLDKYYDQHVKNCTEVKLKSDCHIEKIYEGKKTLKLKIVKDTYYEYMNQGWTVKELKNLSLGHLLSLSLESSVYSSPIKFILPLSRDLVENSLEKSRILTDLGYHSGNFREKVKKGIITLIGKVVQIVTDFDQIASIELEFILDKGEVIVLDCSIKPDLLV
ncbi:MAG: CoA-binding protein [Patescibacteria group bacterium]|nr:CoA-binding protein [Patescibacteria group bacterium]